MLKQKLFIFGVIGTFVLLGAGCSNGQAPSTGATGNGTKQVINMTAKKFEWTPSTITVNKGDTVEIHLTTEDVTHGFGLPDFNVNAQVAPGSPAVVTFVADKAGTFKFTCSVFCGAGHKDMVGTLIVK